MAALGDLWDEPTSYRDTLPAERARAPGRVNPAWLVERASMLRPSGRRQDTIYVATLLVIAVDTSDLISVLAAATGRNATIVARDSGLSIAPGGGPKVMEAAKDDWERAKKAARTEAGRLAGVQAAAEKRRAATIRKTRRVVALWRDRRPGRLSVERISEIAELSPKTLYQELNPRPPINHKLKARPDDEPVE